MSSLGTKRGSAELLRQPRVVDGQEGSALIEMAVSMPALLLVIVGMMKMCLAVYSYHYTSEAAREGARYAIVRGYGASPTSHTLCVAYESGCVATADNISSYVKALGYPALIPANMTVTTAWAGFPTGVTCTPNPAPNCNNVGNLVTVTVQYSFPLSIPFRSTKTLTMTSSASGILSQ